VLVMPACNISSQYTSDDYLKLLEGAEVQRACPRHFSVR